MRALLAALALVAAAGAHAAPLTYTLDPEHSFVNFEVLHFGTSTLRGRFGPIGGDVVLDREAQRGEVGLRIPTAGVSTGLPVLDARLRAGDLLDSANHPDAFFVARQFRFDGDRLAEVRGEFTLRDGSQALSLHALRFACRGDDPRGVEVCGGDFEGEFDRGSFGMTYGLPLIGGRVRLLVQVEGVRR
jgi:polyisoprenoid-binding protein YceI